MDPPWSPSSGKRPRKRKARSPSPDQPPHSPKRASGSQLSATVLPPIREMQAFLPSPGPPSQHPEDVYPQHPQPTGFPLFSGSNPRFMSQAGPSTPAAEYNPEIMDSEPEADAEPSGRPKQKRRRQALSCTGACSLLYSPPSPDSSPTHARRLSHDSIPLCCAPGLRDIVFVSPCEPLRAIWQSARDVKSNAIGSPLLLHRVLHIDFPPA